MRVRCDAVQRHPPASGIHLALGCPTDCPREILWSVSEGMECWCSNRFAWTKSTTTRDKREEQQSLPFPSDISGPKLWNRVPSRALEELQGMIIVDVRRFDIPGTYGRQTSTMG